VQAQLGGVSLAAPVTLREGALCAVCMDAPNNHLMPPCTGMCTCAACRGGVRTAARCAARPMERIERVVS